MDRTGAYVFEDCLFEYVLVHEENTKDLRGRNICLESSFPLSHKTSWRLNSKNDKLKYVILRAIYITEEYESIMKILQDAGNTGE